MNYRLAKLDDCRLLAKLNQQLLQDEQHRNRFMTEPQLMDRMRGFLAGEYRGVIFEHEGEIVAYALYRDHPDEIYLRQLFVQRDRRRHGFGRQAVGLLRSHIWPRNKRLTVDVLVHNAAAIAFWRSVGYQDYLLGLEIPPVASA
jgi:ribosomal protein S18 acetylase RimI-like enzyme